MNITRITRIMAGSFVLISLALGVEASPLFHSAYWLWFTVFVGANLLISGLANWCLMDKILSSFGVKDGCASRAVKGSC